MTIAATYTTAVIGMAVLKTMKGTLLEENTARTVGSIGGNVATGAIFTLPAFYIASIWNPFFSLEHYILSTVMLVFAGILGIMYVTILRRVLVEDAELPFPESIAAPRFTNRARAECRIRASCSWAWASALFSARSWNSSSSPPDGRRSWRSPKAC